MRERRSKSAARANQISRAVPLARTFMNSESGIMLAMSCLKIASPFFQVANSAKYAVCAGSSTTPAPGLPPTGTAASVPPPPVPPAAAASASPPAPAVATAAPAAVPPPWAVTFPPAIGGTTGWTDVPSR